MDIQQVAKEIARTHSQLLAGETPTVEVLANEIPADSTPIFAAAWLGARLLGFVPHDARYIAKAWQSQTARLEVFDATNWPRDPQDFALPVANPSTAFAPCPQSLGLYAVLPDADWIARMVELQVPTVQLRFKSDDHKAIDQQVQAAVKAVEGSDTLLFINDHWQHAIDAGAYGVHLGQEDMVEAPLEAIKAAGLRLGLSSHGYAEMLKAHAAQPSYLALGAVFPTTLKRMATAPQGLGRLGMYARLMQGQSLVAIGGIDLERLPAVMQTGVGSTAFVRAITAAVNVPEAVEKLRQCMKANKR
ncbi:MAG: thiamine phosphate synthase [Betaproteobacteria bacterium]